MTERPEDDGLAPRTPAPDVAPPDVAPDVPSPEWYDGSQEIAVPALPARFRIARTLGVILTSIVLLTVGFLTGFGVGERVLLTLEDPPEPEPSSDVAPGPPTIRIGDAGRPVTTGEPRFDERVCPDLVRSDVRCGFLDVPESRSDPEGRRVRIAVAIREAPTADREPGAPRRAVVVLTGGPGVPIVADGLYALDSPAFDTPGADVIILDQRGSGRSVPTLACPGVGIGVTVPRPAETAGLVACATRNLVLGIDPGAFSTRESAADIADLRIALGYDQFDLVGLSYGTRLALEVVRHHPEGVRSIVLAGVAPPDAPDAVIALRVAQVILHLDEVCKEQADCREAYGSLERLLLAAMARAVSDGGRELITALNDALFGAAYWVNGLVTLPRALAAAADGDWDGVGMILPSFGVPGTDVLTERPPRSGPSDAQESFGLYATVTCTDFDGRVVRDPADPPIRQRLIAGGAGATYREMLELGDAVLWLQCRLWGTPAPSGEPRSGVESDVPALVVSGRFDPTTPAHFGDLAAAGLSNSFVVVAEHLAHGLVLADPCIDSIVAEFLTRIDTPPATECLAEMPLPTIELP